MTEEKLYKKMYTYLFNSVTDILENIEEDPEAARLMLMAAQLDCERMYIEKNPNKKKQEPRGPFATFFKNIVSVIIKTC